MNRTWPYFNTPLIAFFIVMFPICGMMTLLAVMPQHPMIRASGGVVLVCSLYAFVRGYVRRLRVEPSGVRFLSLAGNHFLAWSEIARIERYVPSGAANGAKFVYVTKLDRPPGGLAEMDSQTFQLQDRKGLLEALQEAWQAGRTKS